MFLKLRVVARRPPLTEKIEIRMAGRHLHLLPAAVHRTASAAVDKPMDAVLPQLPPLVRRASAAG